MKFEVENNLITHLSQIDLQESAINSLLQNEIDWLYIFNIAEEHRVIPLLFKHIKSSYSQDIPKDIFNKFQNRVQEISTYNFARSTQLIKLVDLLNKYKFPVLSYKGMTLAELAYNDTTLRQFTDIDLLVQKKDFYKIKTLLEQIDCRPAWDLTDKQEKAVLKHYYEYPFFYGKANILLEVHWDFIESFFAFDFDTNLVWERTTDVKLYGKNIRTLSPVDYLIVLSSHGSKHFWKRLSWICDIDHLVRNTEIDWNLVKLRANETGSLRMVLLGLFLSNRILNTPLPGELEDKTHSDETVELLGKMFERNLFTDNSEPDDWKEMAQIHLLMRENIVTKIKYSKRLFTTKLIDKLFLPMGRPQ